jgi:alpha-beta hydrolase superfamily lysophospholipase
MFFPEKLNKQYHFQFSEPFEELHFKTKDNILINGLLFKAKHSKGLIFYLHGNAGSLASWGGVASTYTHLGYDVLMLDYRGFGKSEGRIQNLNQLFDDIQRAYREMTQKYAENQIIVLGYSMGSGLAAKIASANHPKMLILQTPYYNFKDLTKRVMPYIPTFILKYPIMTNEYIQLCKMPIVIFHGKEDEVIYYGSSLKLKTHLKPTDSLITLENQGHNNISEHPVYKSELKKILSTN